MAVLEHETMIQVEENHISILYAHEEMLPYKAMKDFIVSWNCGATKGFPQKKNSGTNTVMDIFDKTTLELTQLESRRNLKGDSTSIRILQHNQCKQCWALREI